MSEATLDDLRDFIRAGGAPSLAEWLSLSAECRAALAGEAEVMRIEQAVRIGSAAQGPAAAAEILAEIDGGALRRRLALKGAGERIVASEVAQQRKAVPRE